MDQSTPFSLKILSLESIFHSSLYTKCLLLYIGNYGLFVHLAKDKFLNKPIDEYQEAFEKGVLLQTIYDKMIGHWDDLAIQVEELIVLHNSGRINLITCFSSLRNVENRAPDFFIVRHILEKALPKLTAPVEATMDCVLILLNEAGQDMAAGMILPPFVDFCSAESTRPREALILFQKNPDKYANLLPQIIVAGTRSDPEFFVNETIQLSRNEKVEIRRIAIFALGLIEYSKIDSKYQTKVLGCFEETVVEENDDQLLGSLTRSAFAVYKARQFSIERVSKVIENALSNGADYTLHAAAELFGSEFGSIPDILLDIFLSNLAHVKPGNKGTTDRMDYGLMQLVKQGDKNKAINLLEAILVGNPETISLDIFQSTLHELYTNPNKVVNRVMTRWFLKGDKVLGEGISAIVNLSPDKNIQLEIDPSEFEISDPMCFVFLARKAIGYLFHTPVTAASIIISLLEIAPNEEVIQILIDLLFDPLSINYPGRVLDYLKSVNNASDKVTCSIKLVLENFDRYIVNINAARNIPELHPSQDQQEIYNRYFSRLISEAMSKAQEDSVFLSLVSKSVLLYGRKSIDYVNSPDGKSNRMEIPLQSHSTQMEFPRFGIIDPFGLDYMLRVFRAERRNI